MVLFFPVRSKVSLTFDTQPLLVRFYEMTLVDEVSFLPLFFFAKIISFILRDIWSSFGNHFIPATLMLFRHLLMIHVDHSLKMWFLFKKTLLCWERSWDHLLFLMFLVLIFHLKYNRQHKDLLTLFDWFVVNRLVKVQLFLLNHAQPGYH